MTLEYIKLLGWKEGCLMNNRLYYHLGNGHIVVHLYDFTCYTIRNNKINYNNPLDENSLLTLTNIVEDLNEIINNPEEYSLKDYLDALALYQNSI